MNDETYMKEALTEAGIAFENGEIPVGAVLVKDGKILAKTHNMCESAKNSLRHAEICAIESAYKESNLKRLNGCTLYVTMEPCPMCAGAIVNARISKVIYGTKDPRAGAFGSLLNLSAYPLESKPDVQGGVLEAECRELLTAFFKNKREK